MDCNNYSYVNTSSKSNQIAFYEDDDHIIFFDVSINYFNETWYTVDDILTGYFDEFKTYTEAARAYNSIVPDDHIIPLF